VASAATKANRYMSFTVQYWAVVVCDRNGQRDYRFPSLE